MKHILATFFIFYILNINFGQSDITTLPEFHSQMGVKPDSKIKPTTMFFKDGKVIVGTIVFESIYEDPNFALVDMQRFGYELKGKIKRERFKFDKLDSLLIGTYMYRFKKIKIPTALMSVTHKNALYRVINDFKRTSVIMFVPVDAPFGSDLNDLSPLKLVEHKEKEKFFQIELGLQNFTKSFSKFLDDCPELAQEIKDNKEKEPKKSLLQKAMSNDSKANDVVVLEALAKYDSCELKK